MNNDEQKFQDHIDSIRFDDAPDAAHRDKLEKQLLEAYDTRVEYADYEEPVAVYFRKLAIAAGFLIVAGVLFWGIDRTVISRDPIAQLPDQPGIQEIIEQENVTGQEKKELLTQIYDVGTLIEQEDTDGLVSVVKTTEFPHTVRTWAAKWLGRFGNEETLAALEEKIHNMNITDPNHPLIQAARQLREKLHRPESQDKPNEPAGMQSLENNDENTE